MVSVVVVLVIIVVIVVTVTPIVVSIIGGMNDTAHAVDKTDVVSASSCRNMMSVHDEQQCGNILRASSSEYK